MNPGVGRCIRAIAALTGFDVPGRGCTLFPRRKHVLPSFRGPRSGAGFRVSGGPWVMYFACLDEWTNRVAWLRSSAALGSHGRGGGGLD